jgi:superfamily I DNA/RNA helicase
VNSLFYGDGEGGKGILMRLENWFISNPDISQQEVLKVPINQNLVVKGAAGSGKTNMAIYRANQAGDNSFVIVVYTVALKKMVRYGLSELGLDKDRVVHEWSWIHRGIEISGDVFCLTDNGSFGLNSDLLILQENDNKTRFFAHFNIEWVKDEKNPPNKVRKDKGDCYYQQIVSAGECCGYKIRTIDNPIEVSIDFDDWVANRFYYSFGRRSRWFREIELIDFKFNPNTDNMVLIPSGFLFKEKGRVNYLIIDEGQDFSISDYQTNFKAEISTTIFGDTNQQLYRNRGTNVEDIVRQFNYPLRTLDFNYRVPKTVAKVAQTIPLPHLDLLSNNRKNNGNSDSPSFPKPIIKKCDSENAELQYILNRIQTEGLDDVAILLFENTTVEKVNKFLSQNGVGTQVRFTVQDSSIPSGFRKVDTLDFTNHDLPCLLSFHSAKGTEFDNVFIPFANDDSKMDRNAFYVAVTRSSSRLFITYSRKLTSLLKDVNPNDVNYQ